MKYMKAMMEVVDLEVEDVVLTSTGCADDDCARDFGECDADFCPGDGK